jgi:UDP-N-acetylglucosamine 2-epimerase
VSRKICVVTVTLAEYGLLRWVMKGIKENDDLDLQLIVTGMHLSPEFELTYKGVQEDGFTISGVTKSMGMGLIGFGGALQ